MHRLRSPKSSWNRAAVYCGLSLTAIMCLDGSRTAVFAQDKAGDGKVALASLQDAFVSIADEVEPTVVTISSSKAGRGPAAFGGASRSVGTGTGVIVRKDGWVLTNDHVVNGADRVTVKLHDGREFTGTVYTDPRSDLAMVKIDAHAPLTAARLGNSDGVKVGQWAIAIGSPFKYEGSLSVGVISSLMRKQLIDEPSEGMRGKLYPNMIQTDAAINPGNSGGPLCNLAGEVSGINTAIQSSQTQGGSIGIGCAIPINTAKFVMTQLLEKGKVAYGFLGVSPTSITPRQASALKVDSGALLFKDPASNSPAARAGLKAGDVIVSIAGKQVKSEIDLRTIVAQTPPSSVVEIKYVRDGSPKVVSATLEKAEDEPQAGKSKAIDKPELGLEVEKLSDDVADRINVPHSTPGVVLRSISPNSAAADEEDLTEGSVILKINDVETPTVDAFKLAVSKLKTGDAVRVCYLKSERGEGPVRRFTVIALD